MDIKLNQLCSACLGTGIRRYNITPGGALLEENPCSECGGDGRAEAAFKIESSYFDEKFSDILDKVNDIKEKVDEIMDKLNE